MIKIRAEISGLGNRQNRKLSKLKASFQKDQQNLETPSCINWKKEHKSPIWEIKRGLSPQILQIFKGWKE